MLIATIKLSKAGKMPSQSYSLPAQACRTGSKLAQVKGSVCSGCYALKGNYRFANVKAPREQNLELVRLCDAAQDFAPWVESMVGIIRATESSGFFRWHDSGDVQSLAHLEAIAEVARRLPAFRFWLPTKEKGDVLAYVRKHGDFPFNLTVRLSAPMVDGEPSAAWSITSTVQRNAPPQGVECPAPSQGGKCLTCRQCWSREVANVSYRKH